MTARSRTAHARKTRVGVAAVALVAAGLLSACTTVGDPATTADSSTAGESPSAGASAGGSEPPATPAAGLPSGVTAESAQQLCDDLADQTQAMRTYTVTVGKGTLNGVVGTWAFKNNLNLVDLAQHRDKVDSILQTQCPDVRAEVMSALDLPDIASGLMGT